MVQAQRAPTVFFTAGFDRGACFAIAAIVAALNGKAHFIVATVADRGPGGATLDLFVISAVAWFALYAMARIALETQTIAAEPLRRGDALVLALVGVAVLLPLPAASAYAGLVAALWLFLTSDRADQCRRIAIIMLALSGYILVGRLLLLAFSGPLLAFDGHVVALLGGTSASGNLVALRDGAGAIIISSGCSSIHNMSLAILCWTALIQLLRIRLDRRLCWFIGLSLLAMFLINCLRLAAMTNFPAQIESIHEGDIAALIGWTSLICLAGIAFWGVLDAAKRQI